MLWPLCWRSAFAKFRTRAARFARASRHVADFNTRNKLSTLKLLKQGYRYHKFRKYFLNFIYYTMI